MKKIETIFNLPVLIILGLWITVLIFVVSVKKINKNKELEEFDTYISVNKEVKEMNLNEEEEFEFIIVGRDKETDEIVPLKNLRYEYYSLHGSKDLIEIFESEKNSSDNINKLLIKRKQLPKEHEFIKFTLNIFADNAQTNSVFFYAGEF